MKYVVWYRDLYVLHRRIVHGDVTNMHGKDLEEWQQRAEDFVKTIAELINKIIS